VISIAFEAAGIVVADIDESTGRFAIAGGSGSAAWIDERAGICNPAATKGIANRLPIDRRWDFCFDFSGGFIGP